MPRTQIKEKIKKTHFKKKVTEYKLQPIKIIQESKLIKMIFIYSAKKIKAKPPLLYSTLNPETNSDSPSAKSKGERLVSAKQDLNQQKNKGREKNINQTPI